MEYKTRQWHENCFCCCVCKMAIGTKSFIPREQEIYCAGCYEEKFATRCIKCNKVSAAEACQLGQEVTNWKYHIYPFAGNHLWWCNLQERAVASRVLHLHPLQHNAGRAALHQSRREAVLCRVLWWALRQALHIVRQTNHWWVEGTGPRCTPVSLTLSLIRHRRHALHLVRGAALASRLLCVRQLQDQPGGTRLHHRRTRHSVPRLCQAEADVSEGHQAGAQSSRMGSVGRYEAEGGRKR